MQLIFENKAECQWIFENYVKRSWIFEKNDHQMTSKIWRSFSLLESRLRKFQIASEVE